MKRFIVLIAGLALVASLAAGGGSASTAKAPKTARVLIRHQMRGCHTWAVNGGKFRPTVSTSLARGGTIRFVNTDIMPHKLIRTRGPAARFVGKPNMNKMGASVKVVLAKAGVYHFTTKAGEDYPGMDMKTTGEDNVLRLTVKVT